MDKKMRRYEPPSEFRPWEKGKTADKFFEIVQSDEASEFIKSVKDSVSDVFLDELEQKLAQLNDTGGVLVFDAPLKEKEIAVLAAHSKAKEIKEVRYESWATHPKKDTRSYYQKRLNEFEKANSLALPEFVLDIIRFYDLVLKDGIKDFENTFDFLDEDTYGLLYLVSGGFLGYIINEQEYNYSLSYYNQPHHNINYFSLGHDSDNYNFSWGITFDFELQAFTGYLCTYEWLPIGEDTYFERLNYLIETAFDDTSIEDEKNNYDAYGDFRDFAHYIINTWWIQVLMTGFLNMMKIPVPNHDSDISVYQNGFNIDDLMALWKQKDKESAKTANPTLQSLPEDFCPEFIKKNYTGSC